MNKEGSFKPIFIVMILSLLIASFWDSIEALKNSVHYILDPTIGGLLNWNLTLGMMLTVFVIALLTTLVQKYATDQKTLKEMKKEQKELQKEMKLYKDNPEKIVELNKKSFEVMPKMMKLSMRPIMFTGVPFILLFRWFMDVFTPETGYTIAANPTFLGFLSWFWFYLIFTILFSSLIRKVIKVV